MFNDRYWYLGLIEKERIQLGKKITTEKKEKTKIEK